MVLYGVQRIFLQEIDPVTKLPVEGGATLALKCAESVDLEPVVEDGEESNLKCPSSNSIIASRLTQDTFVGYDITITDNEWNPEAFALINGFDTIVDEGEITTLITPFIEQGMNFKPFRTVIFAAAYEGSDITKYVVFVLNSCKGNLSTISLSQDWSQIEYTINAREATAVGFPVMSVGYYAGAEAPDDLTGVTITAGVIQPGAPTQLEGRIGGVSGQVPAGTTSAKVTKAKESDK